MSSLNLHIPNPIDAARLAQLRSVEVEQRFLAVMGEQGEGVPLLEDET